MREIELTQGKFALVDDWNYVWLSQWKWNAYQAHGIWYVQDTCGVKMHRKIMQTPDGLEVDHKDGDGLNNQEYNMCNCTRSQNAQNRRDKKNYQGVFWQESRKKYLCQIEHQKTVYHLGRFVSANEAALAYNEAALKLFGESARLNIVGV